MERSTRHPPVHHGLRLALLTLLALAALLAPARPAAASAGGTVRAWDWNSSGQTDVPAGLSDVTAIAAGGGHTVALRSDGTVRA